MPTSSRERGGLHIIGTERHEARRIDNQLRGRAGRQGDPGSSRFYISLEDDLMKRFGPSIDRVKGIMGRAGFEDDMPIEFGVISRSIESAQTKVEGYNFDMRKRVVDYDDVMNKQREVIYARRRAILEEGEEQRRIKVLVERYLGELRRLGDWSDRGTGFRPRNHGRNRDSSPDVAGVARQRPTRPRCVAERRRDQHAVRCWHR